MATGRLFEILYYLIDVKQTTAKQLAEHFEVSTRTIYRDLDRLLIAGIPITSIQGSGGGISIDPQYVFDKAVLNHDEQEQILAAIEGLSSLHLQQYQDLLGRMKSIFQKESQDWIEVDFSSWHKEQQIDDLFLKIKEGILKQQAISFDYINVNGESHRYVYPLKLIFKSQAWYLQAYESQRQVYRTYKLKRMKNIEHKDEYFDKSKYNQLPVLHYQEESSCINVVLKFKKYLGSFVYDEFPMSDIEERQDCYIVKSQIESQPWLISFLLSFGSGLEVIEPIELRKQIYEEVRKILELYQQT